MGRTKKNLSQSKSAIKSRLSRQKKKRRDTMRERREQKKDSAREQGARHGAEDGAPEPTVIATANRHQQQQEPPSLTNKTPTNTQDPPQPLIRTPIAASSLQTVDEVDVTPDAVIDEDEELLRLELKKSGRREILRDQQERHNGLQKAFDENSRHLEALVKSNNESTKRGGSSRCFLDCNTQCSQGRQNSSFCFSLLPLHASSFFFGAFGCIANPSLRVG